MPSTERQEARAIRASMIVRLRSVRLARSIFRALRPEADHSPEPFTEARLHLEGRAITLELRGRELSHFKAAINSWLRLISTSQEAITAPSSCKVRTSA